MNSTCSPGESLIACRVKSLMDRYIDCGDQTCLSTGLYYILELVSDSPDQEMRESVNTILRNFRSKEVGGTYALESK